MFSRIFTLTCSIFVAFALSAQLQISTHFENQITGSNAFFDASAFCTESGTSILNSEGVGLVFPTVDLVDFEFFLDYVYAELAFHLFHGMIVFNRGTGTTETDGYRSAVAVDVEPGFYFFYNPNGRAILEWEKANNEGGIGTALAAIRDGVWKPLGATGGRSPWLVGGNEPLPNNEPMILGIRHSDTNEPAPANPIIIYGAVRVRVLDNNDQPIPDGEGGFVTELVNRPIMRIGSE